MNIFSGNEEASGSLAPQHELELLFYAANSDPVMQAKFYQRLLVDVVFVIIYSNPLWEAGEHIVEGEEEVAIYGFEDGVIPVFTSEDRIFDNENLPPDLQYIRVRGDQVLNVGQQCGIIINPFTENNVTFPPEHVAKILDGSIFGKREEVLAFEEGEAVMRLPVVYPEKAFDALKRLYKTMPEVLEAYAVEVAYENKKPFLMIAVNTQGDFASVSSASSYVFNQNQKLIKFIQFYQLTGTGAYDKYFPKTTKPFYKKYDDLALN